MQSEPSLGLRSSTFACWAEAAMALVASAPTGIAPSASAFHKSSSSSSSCCWDTAPGWKNGGVSICTTQEWRGAHVHLGGRISREGSQQQRRVVHGGGVRCAVEEAATAPLVVPDTVPRTPAPWWVSLSLSLSPSPPLCEQGFGFWASEAVNPSYRWWHSV